MKSMTFKSISLALISLISTSSVLAVELKLQPKAVVELFTSQGCASCPTADILLEKIGARSDVLTLAYHVDYWDYTGWRDTFGSPEATHLQQGYARTLGNGHIYTPQMIINGKLAIVGSSEQDLINGIENVSLPLALNIDIETKSALTVTIPANGQDQRAVVWLVYYQTNAEVNVTRGENTGQSLKYTDIVLSRMPIGTWNGLTGTTVMLPYEETMEGNGNGAAIILQLKNGKFPGEIIAAASIEADK